jgi:hypothetical protein
MAQHQGTGRIVLAIREGIGNWEASQAEVVDGVLIMRRAERQRECCGAVLTLVAEARRGSMTWELRRCLTCEREHSIGPGLPPTWLNALARACIGLYNDYQAAVAEAYGRGLRRGRRDD